MMAPILSMIKGSLYAHFDFKVCIFKSIADHDVLKTQIVPLMPASLMWIFCLYLKFKTNRFLHKICPQQKLSIIGKYRRNFATFDQTMQFTQNYFFYGMFHQGLCFWLFQAFAFEPKTNFLLANICDFLYLDLYHCIFLPMRMEIPPTLIHNKRTRATDFFVRKPQSLEPRRPLQKSFEQRHPLQSSGEQNRSRKCLAVTQMYPPSSSDGSEQGSKTENFLKEKKSVGKIESWKHVHGSMSQGIVQIENSHVRLTGLVADPLPPIDI